MIKSWLFDLPPVDPAAKQGAAFDHVLRLWDRIEALGFEGVMVSEHHWPTSLSASPNLMLAVLAVRTKRLRIGQLALTASLYHPGRLAEELATLDQLSGGRLEIGLARGAPAFAAELETFGIPAQEMQERLNETLEIVEGALTADGPFTYHGKHYHCENLVVSPRPLQKPRPPIWLPVMSAQSCGKAGSRGYKACAGFLATDVIAEMFDSYREAARRAGREASRDDLAIRRAVIVDSDEHAARALGRSVADQLAKIEALRAVVSGDDIIAGTADQVFEEILAQCERTGAGHILLYGNANMRPDEYARIIEHYGAEVLPRLQQASPSFAGGRQATQGEAG
jgi:alkanesulfonate monooxygenase SsuD/methylene tetrahydromethanopterin reductase-like flavin-dependent oxidoreductase (luciferase family)